jgi:hypothetical protein
MLLSSLSFLSKLAGVLEDVLLSSSPASCGNFLWIETAHMVDPSVKTQKEVAIRATILLFTLVFSTRSLLPCENTPQLASGNQVLDADVLDYKR